MRLIILVGNPTDKIRVTLGQSNPAPIQPGVPIKNLGHNLFLSNESVEVKLVFVNSIV